MIAKAKCAHATCTCAATLMSDFCSDECRLAVEREEAGEEPLSECRCGHADCGNVPEPSDEAEEGFSMAPEALGA
jgi:hypothetical protein